MTTTVGDSPSSGARIPRVRAAGADHQQAAVGHHQAEVVAQVAHQACPVGVVPEDAITLDRQRIDRGSMRGPRGKFLGHLDGHDLVPQGHVQAAAAPGEEFLGTRAANSSGATSWGR